MLHFEEMNRVRDDKRRQVRQVQRERELELKKQMDFKDKEIHRSLERLNQFKLEQYQMKGQEKQRRQEIVKGTADAT